MIPLCLDRIEKTPEKNKCIDLGMWLTRVLAQKGGSPALTNPSLVVYLWNRRGGGQKHQKFKVTLGYPTSIKPACG